MSWKHTVEYPHNWPAPTRAKAELTDIAKYVETWARKHQHDVGAEQVWKAVESIKNAVYWLQYAEAERALVSPDDPGRGDRGLGMAEMPWRQTEIGAQGGAQASIVQLEGDDARRSHRTY